MQKFQIIKNIAFPAPEIQNAIKSSQIFYKLNFKLMNIRTLVLSFLINLENKLCSALQQIEAPA